MVSAIFIERQSEKICTNISNERTTKQENGESVAEALDQNDLKLYQYLDPILRKYNKLHKLQLESLPISFCDINLADPILKNRIIRYSTNKDFQELIVEIKKYKYQLGELHINAKQYNRILNSSPKGLHQSLNDTNQGLESFLNHVKENITI